MWNMGSAHRITSPAWSPMFGFSPSTCCATLVLRLRCVSITPLGRPVVPDEYGSATTSSGSNTFSSSSSPASGDASSSDMRSSQKWRQPSRRSSMRTTVRAPWEWEGSLSAAMDSVMTTVAPAAASWLSISCGVDIGFAVVTAAPTRDAAKKDSTNSGEFRSRLITTPPRRSPSGARRSAAARRRDRRSTSA
ncbi:Os08g0245301 [Oryza sativa Japonica Group]|uniref:Os08g0245301 protein n=1 Tax=Oryza sativa subsp. japonica TaxID=39947 RepID=A0A0P0XDQ2_ORYSJ|nr:hypothetical protein EE612_043062 [Oryza sativa]BAT04524.1 Os08g0245301 [Oryza sativa Japonica Group]